jgi:hypothetical protein
MYPLGVMLSAGLKNILPYTKDNTHTKFRDIIQYLRTFKSEEEYPFPYYYSEFIGETVHYCTLRDMETMDKSNLKPIQFFSTASNYTGSRKRYIGKFGKWFKTVADWCKIELTPQELNEIAVAFSAVHAPITIETVEGEAIRHWYLETNAVKQGSLGNSCMRYIYCQKYLDIYVDHCKMVIAKQGDDTKIVGRVLIWKDKYYDRIYSIAPNVEVAILNYLIENGKQCIREHCVDIPLELDDYEYYPYMDNMNAYCEDSKRLSNYIDDYTHEFNNTDGSYHTVDADDDDCDDDDDYIEDEDLVNYAD